MKFLTFPKYALMALVATAGLLSACGTDDEPEPAPEPEPVPTPVVVPQEPAVVDDVIYEVNPRFYGQNNCLANLNAQLDDIAKTGATVLWLMPVNEFGQLKSVNSPYCIRNFKAIDPKMGTVDDLKTVVEKAHAKGMKVILDWIANHTSWDNVWITEHPEWYAQDAAGNIIAPPGMGWTDVAELNYSNAEMRTAMIDAMVYWVDVVGIDGYRCDHVDGVPVDFWKQAIDALRAKRSNLLMLAESADSKYAQAGFDMFYGWSYGPALSKLFTGGMTPAKFVEESNKELQRYPQGCKVMRYAINHDTAAEKSLRETFGSEKALEAATVLTTMMGGVPMYYSGHCFDYTGTLSFFNYGVKPFDSQKAANLGAISRAYQATAKARQGDIVTYNASNCIMFSRTNGSNQMLVVVNLSSEKTSVKLPMALSGQNMVNAIEWEAQTVPNVLSLDSYGYAVYYK